MTDAPNVVDDIQLKELGIDIAEEEKAGDAEAWTETLSEFIRADDKYSANFL